MASRMDNVSYVILRTYLPYLVLKVLMTKGTVTAYTIIQAINDAFQMQLSPGTIYNTLNTLERKGYIDRKLESPEITITTQGKALVLKALRESETITPKIHDFLQRS